MCGSAFLLLVGGAIFWETPSASSIPGSEPELPRGVASTVDPVAPTIRRRIGANTPPGAHASSAPDAVSAHFELARLCHEAAFNRKNWQGQLNACKAADPRDIKFKENCSSYTAGFDEKVRVAETTLLQCSPVPAEIEEDFYKASIEAANQGDPTAQLCYLKSDFDLKRPFERNEIEYYHAVDADYVNGAINRGDWRMIALMARRYRDPAHQATMRSELTGDDPYTLYQMDRLLSLGADGEYKMFVESRAKDAMSDLTPEQTQTADDWAAMIYEKHFVSSPRLTEEPVICESHR